MVMTSQPKQDLAKIDPFVHARINKWTQVGVGLQSQMMRRN